MEKKRDWEFNRRIRDALSRDQVKLRNTFDQYDRQCATRVARIQRMQERVRHTIRSLALEKRQIQEKQRRGSVSMQGREILENDEKRCPIEDKKKVKKATFCQTKTTSSNIDIPATRSPGYLSLSAFGSPQVSRSTTPGITYEMYGVKERGNSLAARPATSRHATLAASLHPHSAPDFPSSLGLSNNRAFLRQHQDFRSHSSASPTESLSVNDLGPLKPPELNIRRRSAEDCVSFNRNGRIRSAQIRRVSDNFPRANRRSTEDLRKITGKPTRQEHRVSDVNQMTSSHVITSNSTKPHRKYSDTRPRPKLVRTRSSSLPDLQHEPAVTEQRSKISVKHVSLI
ncbi:predicted protein [Nematostella vectensis]|uniref:Uncharacterized protein n=1 Tax=Nematostella vectensis TaxID=45351 RepID=A7RQH1_NEMVE|nr:predicted protein [Nematostella vectensis]|eukprot:XP_001638348.1 predicted protein [Nematostella vectensis]